MNILRSCGPNTARRAVLRTGLLLGGSLPLIKLSAIAQAATIRSVEEFGAVGDGQRDDWIAISNALTSADIISFASGKTYKISKSLQLGSNKFLVGNGARIVIRSGLPKMTPVLSLDNCASVEIQDLIVDGNRDGQVISTSGEQNGGLHCIRCYAASNVKIRRSVMQNAYADGLYLGRGCNKVLVEDCTMKSSMRSGCTVTWGSNIDFVRCQFRDSQGQPPEAGVNIEPNYEREVNSAISFHDCIFTGNARRGMKIDLKKRYNRLAGLDVVGCRFFANKSNDGAQMQLSGKDLSLLEMINITGNEFDQRLWTGSSSGTTTFRNVTIDKNIFMKGGVSVWNLNRGSQNVVFSTNRWRKAPTLKSVAFTPTFVGNVMI